ncbi:uncharacterized protein ARMOST_02377 [Armillaria ostoyae]|uniref:HAT C-terminal dimerisation domain-containing protein n=1 Tax=Armillaria ostoyae TaxID=47428 RepID=A0A284QRR2_ARMOS|nr:uncharacterized protein ARMOST_02377 [Armillaria ostoyae]
MSNSSDQCALDTDGRLKPAAQIDFYFDKDDDVPMAGPAVGTKGHSRMRRSNTGGRLKELVDAEMRDEHGQLTAPPKTRRCTKRKKGKRKMQAKSNDTLDGAASESNDSAFAADDDSESCTDTSESDREVTNNEIADILPSKTVPDNVQSKRKHVTVEEIEDDENIASNSISDKSKKAHRYIIEDDSEDDDNSPAPQSDQPSVPAKRTCKVGKHNPIYYFYEEVLLNAEGKPGNKGDKHFKCYHGNRKVLTITKAMKGSLNGLVGHLKTCSAPMYRMFSALRAHLDKSPNAAILQDEIEIANGSKKLDAQAAEMYLKQMESESENIIHAFKKQSMDAKGDWDQDKFERLLAEWLVACDQPFEEVDRPEFRNLLSYAHHHSLEDLHIPHRDAIRRQIMKMGEDSIEETRKMFEELEGKVSISLDAWTSSNNIAFLATVAHYVTNEGQHEDLLIDFRELIGRHTGENMAEAVWDTLTLYGLRDKVIAFMMDNATNNDTLMKGIECRCRREGIIFDEKLSRLRCMPHTVHLAAIKLLEAIGVITKKTAKKATGESSNYQDAATVPVDRSNDNEAALQDEYESGDEADEGGDLTYSMSDLSDDVFSSVDKLRQIVRTVRSSPQRKQGWLREVKMALELRSKVTDATEQVLMLILDVTTRWSSTHQMMHMWSSDFYMTVY